MSVFLQGLLITQYFGGKFLCDFCPLKLNRMVDNYYCRTNNWMDSKLGTNVIVVAAFREYAGSYMPGFQNSNVYLNFRV